MPTTWKILGLLLLLNVVTAVEYSALVGSYIATLIRYLAAKEPGSFDCWFYETAEPQQRTILDYIITLNQAVMIPQRILRATFSIEVSRSPALLIVNYKGTYFLEIGQFLQSFFDRTMKVIVFYDSTIQGELIYAMEYFAYFELHNTIFVRLDSLEIHQKPAYQTDCIIFYGAPPFWQLFEDPVKNLTGHTVHVSHSSSIVESFKFSLKKAKNAGYNENLLNDVIPRLGGRIQYHSIFCNASMSSAECTSKIYSYNSTTMFDFSTNGYTLLELRNEYYMPSVIPSAMIIAVPTGRPFTTFEVFTVPFRQEVWIGFFAFLLICILLMILQPLRITNNLILLPICGFERREFHLVSPGEKTILITLTVIFFALLSAYEAKIIAFMTEFPHQADPRTLDDLLRRNITIQQYGQSWGRTMFEDDPRIGQLFSRSAHQSQHDIQWNSKDHALTAGRSFMQMVLSHPNNYDPDTGRQRFIIMSDFTLGIRIMFMFCGRRNPLAPKIKLEEVWRFEAGLYDLWVRERTRHEFGIRQSRYLMLDSVDVGIAELEPAWYALGIGMGMGCVALVLEFVWKFITGRYQRAMTAMWKESFGPAMIRDMIVAILMRSLTSVKNFILVIACFTRKSFKHH